MARGSCRRLVLTPETYALLESRKPREYWTTFAGQREIQAAIPKCADAVDTKPPERLKLQAKPASPTLPEPKKGARALPPAR